MCHEYNQQIKPHWQRLVTVVIKSCNKYDYAANHISFSIEGAMFPINNKEYLCVLIKLTYFINSGWYVCQPTNVF